MALLVARTMQHPVSTMAQISALPLQVLVPPRHGGCSIIIALQTAGGQAAKDEQGTSKERGEVGFASSFLDVQSLSAARQAC
jgi:hypothetical protein